MKTRLIVAAGLAPLLVVTALARQQPWTPPARSHHPDVPYQSPTSLGAASYAKILCSAVFVSGRDVEEAQKNSAYFLMAEPDRTKPVTVDVDREAKRVRVDRRGHHANGGVLRRSGLRHPPGGHDGIHFTPVPVRTTLPDAASQPWPMGDAPSTRSVAGRARSREGAGRGRPRIRGSRRPHGRDGRRLQGPDRRRALHARHHARTHSSRAGRWARASPPRSSAWSIKDGAFGTRRSRAGARLAPAGRSARRDSCARRDADVEWPQLHGPGRPVDGPGVAISRSLLHLRRRCDAFQYSITSPVEFAPNTVGRYRNSDPMTLGFLVQQAVREEGRGVPHVAAARAVRQDRHPQARCSRPIPWGNFLLSGYDYGTARNWARLGLLYLHDGVWNGQRLLPEGLTTFVSTPAPAWRRQGIRRTVLDQRRRAVEPAARRLFHVRRGRAAHLHRAVARSRDRAHGPPARRAGGHEAVEPVAGRAGRGRRVLEPGSNEH